MMTGPRLFLIALIVVLLALFVWAGANSLTPFENGGLHGDIGQQIGFGSPLLGLPMGLFLSVDRLAALIVIAVIIMLAEKNYTHGVAWALPMVVLGAAWAAVWLAWRLPSLARRLTFPDREEN
jgi:hypothetical protein